MTASTSSTAWTVIGIVLNAVGVIFLFRFGMPYRERRSANVFLVIGRSSERKKAESIYDLLGWPGLACIIVGAAFQLAGAISTPQSLVVNEYDTGVLDSMLRRADCWLFAIGAFVAAIFQLEAAKVERTENLNQSHSLRRTNPTYR